MSNNKNMALWKKLILSTSLWIFVLSALIMYGDGEEDTLSTKILAKIATFIQEAHDDENETRD